MAVQYLQRARAYRQIENGTVELHAMFLPPCGPIRSVQQVQNRLSIFAKRATDHFNNLGEIPGRPLAHVIRVVRAMGQFIQRLIVPQCRPERVAGKGTIRARRVCSCYLGGKLTKRAIGWEAVGKSTLILRPKELRRVCTSSSRHSGAKS
jgi:hypothetical protein